MAYFVTAGENAPTERLVVSVGGISLVYGEALEQDYDAEGVVVVADQEDDEYRTDSVDISSALADLADKVPEVAAAVSVKHVPDVDPQPEVTVEHVEVVPAEKPDTVVAAGETTPSVEREEVVTEDSVGEDAPKDEG